MKKKVTKVIAHILVWMCFFLIVPLMPMRPGESIDLQATISSFCAYVYLVLFFYVNTYLLLPLLIEKKKYSYILFVSLFFLFYYLIQRIIWQSLITMPNELFTPHGMLENRHFPEQGGFLIWRQIGLSFFQFLLFFILSIGYKLSLSWVEINQRNKEIEAEMLKTELSYLKAQINPHFFFNSLNTIYALTLNKCTKASRATLFLSQIVRYVLDKSREDFVSLHEEVAYIEDYISLQKLRFPTILQVNFNVEVDMYDYSIAPLILIPFIENAFQYGVSSHTLSEINILVKAENSEIIFSISNHIYKSPNSVFGRNSIGIENTRKRLDLIYPNRYKLLIKRQKDLFRVELMIKP